MANDISTNRALPCTLWVQPVNSFSCFRAKDSLWDADRTRLRRLHGNGSAETAGGREVDRDEGGGNLGSRPYGTIVVFVVTRHFRGGLTYAAPSALEWMNIRRFCYACRPAGARIFFRTGDYRYAAPLARVAGLGSFYLRCRVAR